MKSPGIIINNIYKLQEKIYEDGFINTFIAEDIQQNRKVQVKILKKESISHRTEDIIRFHNDITSVIQCDHPHIEKIYEVIEEDTMHFIVGRINRMENLYELFNRGYTFEQADIIDIIMQTAKALKYAHGKGILHRDLNPKNIFLSFHKTAIKNRIHVLLSNFAFSRIKELEKITDPIEIENTFCYMSPEECGVIKKIIDESSDLYSLGILFYYLLTDILPFIGKSVSSIIHQHIAKLPSPPSVINKNVSEILDKIVLKLLEKKQENRYQSAEGLIKDLKRFKRGSYDFDPGMDDEVVKLSFKSKLISRHKELEVLRNLLDESVKSHGTICMVRGMSGTGKTRLIEEFRNQAYSKYIPFITGKCFSGENKPPYGPITEALRKYLLFFYSYADDKKKLIQNKLKMEIGYLGQILTSLLPEYNEVIGESPQLVNLDIVKERRRFLITLSRFLCSLANAEGGLVLCLEDLQWADDGSLDLLHEMIDDIRNSAILLIGTYRGDEVTDAHKISLLSKEAQNKQDSFTEIEIHHFNKQGMIDFVSALLNNRVTDIKKIAHFIFTKSAGNPFFAIEVLKKLVSEKIIYYENDIWNIDDTHLHRISIPKEVINILLSRISLLNENEIEILTYAAMIGNAFSLDILFQLCQYEKHVIVDIIDRAVGLQLLESDAYNRETISFAHNRIQEAFYSRIPVNQRKKYHLRIARTIEKLNEDIIEPVLFALAHHYIESGEEDKILEYAFPAGKIAKASYTHKESIKYFQKVIDIIEKKHLKDNDLWLDSLQHIAEIYIIIGQGEKGLEILKTVLQKHKRPENKAQIYHQISLACYKRGDYKKCEEYAGLGLNLLGEKKPVKRRSVIISLGKELIIRLFHSIFPFLYTQNKHSDENSRNKTIFLLYFTLSWSYVITDLLKFMWSVIRFLNFSESKLGRSPEFVRGLSGFASILMTIPLFKRSFKIHYKVLAFREKMEDLFGIAESHQLLGYCYLWYGDYEKAITHYEKSMRLYKVIGDIKEYSISLIGKGECLIYLARYKEAHEKVKEYQEFAIKINDMYAIANAYHARAHIYMETGDLERAGECAFKGYEVCKNNNIGMVHCMLLLRIGAIFLAKNQVTESLNYLEKAKEKLSENRYINHYTSFLHTLFAKAYILEYIQKKDNPVNKKEILRKINIMSKTALRKTRHWAAHYSGALRVRARYYSLTGHRGKAEKYFRLSISHADRHSLKYKKGKSCFTYGEYLIRNNDRKTAQKNLEISFKLFSEIGASLFKKRTAEMLGMSKIDDEYSPKARFMEKQRYSTIIDVSRDIGSLHAPDKLIGKILLKAIEITGAQRGCLFIKNPGTDELEVKSTNNFKQNEITKSIKELAAVVYDSQKSMILQEHDKASLSGESKEPESGSVICVPLQSKEEIVGVCYLDNLLTSGVFSREDLQILEVIMTHAAISIENASLNQNIKQYTMKIMEIEKQLYQVDRLSTLGTSISEILHEINNFNSVIKNNTYVLSKQFKQILPVLDDYYNKQGDFRIGRSYYSELRNLYPRFYERIIRNSENIQHLVKVMKNFSKIDQLRTNEVDIHQVIEEALDICSLKAKKRNVQIIYKNENNLPCVHGQKQYLTQVIINIVNNSIEAANKEIPFVKINVVYDDELHEIVIHIEDNGEGIEPGNLQRLTEPFFTTKDSKGGTGLGLSLVFKIIQSHNGRINFQSEKDKGTVVTIMLPV